MTCNCDTMSWALAGWRAVHLLAGLMPVSLLSFNLWVERPGRRTPTPLARSAALVIMACTALTLVSGIAWLVLVAANVVDEPASTVWRDGALAKVLLHTRFGAIWMIRGGSWLVASGLTLALLDARARRSVRWRTATMLAWAVTVAGIALSGHAADVRGMVGVAHELSDVVHLLTSAVWPLGLIPLVVVLWPGRAIDAFERLAVTQRYSGIALICVGLLVVSGSINTIAILPNAAALIQTQYGRLLMVKLAVLAAMVGLAALNRCVLLPRLCASATAVRKSLWLSVMVEAGLGVSVFGVVGVLGLLWPEG